MKSEQTRNFWHFDFVDGSEPLDTSADEMFWWMVRNFDVEQTGEKTFKVLQWKRETLFEGSSYKLNKGILRDFAIVWQHDLENYDYDYLTLSEYGGFFRIYGKKYGLLTEFKENGIPC